MAFVLDASVAACWVFDDDDHPLAATALERLRREAAHVPALWWFEIRNVLVAGERRGRLAEADTATFLRALSRLAVTIDQAPGEESVLALARRHRLSVYDASYLELAQRQTLPLATLDRDLRQAAMAAGVALLEDQPSRA